MARKFEPWMTWTAAGLGALGLGMASYAVVTLAASPWPSEGDDCSIDTYREILGARTSAAGVEGAWRYMPMVRYAARYHGVSPELLAGLVDVESRWNPTAGSGAGAVGLTQHIASTAAGTFRKLADSNRWPFTSLSSSNDPARDGKLAELGVADWIDRTDPRQSLWLGAATLKSLLNVGKGTQWALAAYNGGAGVANKPVDQRPLETQNYVPAVLKRTGWYEELDRACHGGILV